MSEEEDDLEEVQNETYWDKMGVTQCRLCEAHLYPGTFFHYCGDIIEGLDRLDRILTKTGIIEVKEDLRNGIKDLTSQHFKTD